MHEFLGEQVGTVQKEDSKRLPMLYVHGPVISDKIDQIIGVPHFGEPVPMVLRWLATQLRDVNQMDYVQSNCRCYGREDRI